MTNSTLRALQAHTKEPEEVDWEARYIEAMEQTSLAQIDNLELRVENDRLKNVILDLEQKRVEPAGRSDVTQALGPPLTQGRQCVASPIQKCAECNTSFHSSDGHECNV